MVKPKTHVELKKCLACGGCVSVCPQDAIMLIASKTTISQEQCIGCGICIKICPIGALTSGGKKT